MFTLESWVWAISILLIALYALAGFVKVSRPIPEQYVGSVSPGLNRFIGAAEIAGSLGLFLPVLAGILPWLTPLAALGFSVIQVLAIGFHARRGELAKSLPVNLILLALSLFVLWGRKGLLGL